MRIAKVFRLTHCGKQQTISTYLKEESKFTGELFSKSFFNLPIITIDIMKMRRGMIINYENSGTKEVGWL
jgi:hypothetical protein